MNKTKQRIALAIEYDGRGLCGWQRQDNGPTVQAYLEAAFAAIESRRVPCVAAGRTDAGVHAEAQLIHADVDASRFERSVRAYTHGLNGLLPESIRAVSVCAVEGDFHARFDCRERAYRYQIWNRTTSSAVHRWRHWWMPRPMDVDAMQDASTYMLGQHDFSSFRASGCQADSATREIRDIYFVQDGFCLMIHFRADAFLYHMVRNMVGALVYVGVGKWQPHRIAEVLEARNRNCAAPTAPAHGLYFTDAVYDAFSSSRLVGIS